MLASFANMGYTFFGVATVQMLPDLCSNKTGFTVQIRRILHRDCIRVHLFKGMLEDEEYLFAMDQAERKERYLGFFIVRPLPRFPLGRSLISPLAFKDHIFVCCLTKTRVSLLGIDLEVHGFPHVAQDTETQSCAESSLWSLLEYFSSKYQQYSPLLPSQIVLGLTGFSEHRLLPSGGLTVSELLRCLQSNGHQCLIYDKDGLPGGQIDLLSFMQIYIESGIPLLVALFKEGAAHAVLAIGHEDPPKYDIPPGTWQDISSYQKKVVFIDDNMPPYRIADPSQPIGYYSGTTLSDISIRSFIVPLQKHMYLDAAKAFSLVSEIFNDTKIGLATFSGKWLTRLFLTGGHSFKSKLLQDAKLDAILKNVLVKLAYPRFIWVCEVYKQADFAKELCSGLLIMDATGGNSLSSILWYTILDKQMIHDGSTWVGSEPIKSFTMSTYRHNLKGGWNGWAS
jgi:hypothetical protein